MADNETQQPAAAPAPTTPPETAAAAAKPDAPKGIEEIKEARREALRQQRENPPKVEAKPETAAAPEAKPAAKPEADADELLELISEQRKLAAARTKLDADRAALKELEPEVAKVRQARELAKTDPLGAVKAILGDLSETFLTQLAQRLTDDDDDVKLTKADIDRMVQEQLVAAKKAEEDGRQAETAAAAAARAAAVASKDAAIGPGFGAAVVEIAGLADAPPDEVASTVDGYAAFVTSVVGAYQGAPDRYPAIGEFEVSAKDVVSATQSLIKARGAVPSVPEVLTHINETLAAKARKLLGATTPPVKPPTSVSNRWGKDPGRTPPATAPKSYREIKEERMRRLRDGA